MRIRLHHGMQNYTPSGATVAEISVTEQRKCHR